MDLMIWHEQPVTVRELSSGEARHARTGSISVVVNSADGWSGSTVEDTGVVVGERGGVPDNRIVNLCWRATDLGGALRTSSRIPCDGLFRWEVPIGD